MMSGGRVPVTFGTNLTPRANGARSILQQGPTERQVLSCP